MIETKIETIGSRDIQTKITGLIGNAPRKTRRAVDNVTTIQLRAIRAKLSRKRTGLLGKSLGKKVIAYGGTVVGMVGPRRSFGTTLVRVDSSARRSVLVGERTWVKKGKGIMRKEIKLKAAKRVRVGDRLSPTQYAHLVEALYPFLKPGYESTLSQARAMLRKELARLNKKGD